MKPYLPPVFTRASPSEKSQASSNRGVMTTAPALSIYPKVPSFSNRANPSENFQLCLNCGLMTTLPAASR